jgi:hypothetical protein
MPEALPRFLHRAAHIFLHPEVFAALPFFFSHLPENSVP